MTVTGTRRQLSALLTGHKLFLKIFLWFWLMLLGILGGFLFAPRLTRFHEVQAPNMNAVVAPMLASQAVKAYEAGGPAGFARFARENIDDQGRKLYLLDGMYRDVLGRPLPEHGFEVAKRVRANQLLIFQNDMAAYRYISSSGKPYIFLLSLNNGVGKLVASADRRQWALFWAILVLVTVPCFWLAHHIAGPIVEVQAAAQRVAQGDLSARAPARLLKRHDELRDLSGDFNFMVARIQALVGTQKRLLASVSHETRSPLTRLTMATALLRRYEQPETAALLDRVDREVATMDVLMGQLLTLTRLEGGGQRSKVVPVDLLELLEGVIADANFEADAEAPRVHLSATESAHMEGADAVAIRSALDNVVRNALRYTPVPAPVEVDLHADGRLACIHVRDGGPGVPAQHLEAIFQPFFRVLSEPEGALAGNGLGLTIAAEAVHLHGGTITACNRRSGGLEVEIRLPLTAPGATSAGSLQN